MTGRRRAGIRSTPGKSATRRKRRFRLSQLWPGARLRRRWWRTFHRAPAVMQVFISAVVVLTLAVIINWIFQVIRKPTELFFPVSATLYKTPTETWRQYATLFRRYSTSVMTPELLAAMAQVEGSGNPVVRTYWRWSWRINPFPVYRPAST